MTAHIPPTPPAMRERKLDSVCFEASTTSVLTSSADGIEGVDDDDEEEDICGASRTEKTNNVGREKRNGIEEFSSRSTAEAHECAKPAFSPRRHPFLRP